MEEVKILELFAGIGACSKAFENLGIPHKIVDAVEIDKYAIASFNAVHHTNFEPQDITKWDKDIEVDLIMHGSPCFLAGEKVNTINGLKNIETIEVGDIVKSHDGTYNKVIKTMKNKGNLIYDIKSSAVHNINTTFNHPFYVLRGGEKCWVEAKDLRTTDYLCIPINKESRNVNWDGSKLYYNNHIGLSNKLPFEDDRFWYLIGRFIGDGWVVRRPERNNNISGIKICCGKQELEELTSRLGDLFNYCVVEDKTTYKLQFTNKELGEFCNQFGVGAINKHIPQNILDIDVKYLKPMMNGLLESDGCFTNDQYKYSSISKELVYNVGELVLKVLHVPYRINKSIRTSKCIIEGREVNQHNSYTVSWRLSNWNDNINYVDDDYLYSRIRKIGYRVEELDVYNLEVEDTHTYCVDNVAVHNCQDFSLAGLQAGGDEGTGTRSSLMYESLRIIKKLKPKYVIWENVKNLISDKHVHNFEKYLNTMEMLGYENAYKVMNAKDYGIPQNRERVFTVSIRKDLNKHYVFPLEKPLTLRLKDMLDKEVDERYYLSDKALNGVLNTQFTQSTLEARTENKDGCIPTLAARDYKDPKLVVEDETLKIKNATALGYLDAKEGDDVNADIAQTLTAKGQQNWTGSFISPDIEYIEKSNSIGSTDPTVIHLKNGETITSDEL